MEGIQDYLFHYNPYTGLWSGFKREDSKDYFNGKLDPISDTNIKVVMKKIKEVIDKNKSIKVKK